MALVEIHFHMPPGLLDPAVNTRIERIEKQMSDLLKAEQATEAAETALETRVTAHEKNDADVAAALQAQIAALQASNADLPTVIANLTALSTHMTTFDAAAPTPAPVPTPTPTP